MSHVSPSAAATRAWTRITQRPRSGARPRGPESLLGATPVGQAAPLGGDERACISSPRSESVSLAWGGTHTVVQIDDIKHRQRIVDVSCVYGVHLLHGGYSMVAPVADYNAILYKKDIVGKILRKTVRTILARVQVREKSHHGHVAEMLPTALTFAHVLAGRPVQLADRVDLRGLVDHVFDAIAWQRVPLKEVLKRVLRPAWRARFR